MANAPVKGQTAGRPASSVGRRAGTRLPHVLTEAEVAALLKRVNTGCPTGLRNRAALGQLTPEQRAALVETLGGPERR